MSQYKKTAPTSQIKDLLQFPLEFHSSELREMLKVIVEKIGFDENSYYMELTTEDRYIELKTESTTFSLSRMSKFYILGIKPTQRLQKIAAYHTDKPLESFFHRFTIDSLELKDISKSYLEHAKIFAKRNLPPGREIS